MAGADGVPWICPRLGTRAARATRVSREAQRRAELAELRNEVAMLRGQVALVQDLTGQPLELHLQRWQLAARMHRTSGS
jgi:hypothetical protein